MSEPSDSSSSDGVVAGFVADFTFVFDFLGFFSPLASSPPDFLRRASSLRNDILKQIKINIVKPRNKLTRLLEESFSEKPFGILLSSVVVVAVV